MRRCLFCIACLLVSTLSFAQTDNIKKHAVQMGNALLQKDFKGFVRFTYPKILKDMGGDLKMASNIERQMKGIEAQGAQIISLTYGEPGTVLKQGKELQCTISQTMIMKTPQGRIQSKSTLIALSADNGNRWYFVDAGERDIETVRQSLPNVSKSLHLPKPEPPQLLKN
jgi:hypothetical protein